MTLLRSLLAAVVLTAVAACASLPARPAGGMVADLTEDTAPILAEGLSPDFATEAKRIDVQQRTWKVISERYYDPRLNGVNWAGIREKYRPRVAAAKTDVQFYLALKAMVRELKDSHTRVVTPRESVDHRRFAALASGAALSVIADQLVIVDIEPDTPAARAGRAHEPMAHEPSPAAADRPRRQSSRQPMARGSHSYEVPGRAPRRSVMACARHRVRWTWSRSTAMASS